MSWYKIGGMTMHLCLYVHLPNMLAVADLFSIEVKTITPPVTYH